MHRSKRWVKSSLVSLIALWSVGVTMAQEFPNRPIRLIAPFSAGASTDLLARVVAQSMSKKLGQQVVVDNKPGAGGIVAAEMTARSAPDGYTFMLTSAGIVTMNQSIYTKLPYDPLKDFAPLTIAVRMPIAIVVNPAVPIHTMGELLSYAKANPGKLTYGSAGTGTSQHLAGELFKSMAHVNLLHVPYKGGGPAMNDLLANQVSMMFVQVPSALPQIQAGRIRAVAVGSDKRDAKLPNAPTVAESGIAGYNSDTWYGFVMPTGVPKPIAQKLYASVIDALKENEQKLSDQGFNLDGGSPEKMEETIKVESTKWASVIKAANIRAD
ncbi:tripartite tricarboxylate transporter substrate binding protein [Diaphorobacter ruginosibacter]|uniref:Bug family tripartite tricarboxylate transporter substrate binding protein n=1 Tax=Diaphorobacter ruginosibacter TaxID=1715720 RepID=UPI00333F97CE